jgi:hypothetical protein
MPRSEADLQAALGEGLIGESHYLDLKEVPSAKGANKESARDMASFAIDGGTLMEPCGRVPRTRDHLVCSFTTPGRAANDAANSSATSNARLHVLTHNEQYSGSPGRHTTAGMTGSAGDSPRPPSASHVYCLATTGLSGRWPPTSRCRGWWSMRTWTYMLRSARTQRGCARRAGRSTSVGRPRRAGARKKKATGCPRQR